MSKLGMVCGLVLMIAALACGDDDGSAGVGGGNTVCDQAAAKYAACNPDAGGGTGGTGGGTSDAGMVNCTGTTACAAQCVLDSTCETLAMISTTSPFFMCVLACQQAPAP
jgi:hypothetical protein